MKVTIIYRKLGSERNEYQTYVIDSCTTDLKLYKKINACIGQLAISFKGEWIKIIDVVTSFEDWG